MTTYISVADKLLSAKERQELIEYLAEHPKDGDVMEGASGVRKLRWGRNNRGKSAGVRAIYYYHRDFMPLYLLILFGKGDKSDLTKAECNEVAGLVDILVNIWKGRNP